MVFNATIYHLLWSLFSSFKAGGTKCPLPPSPLCVEMGVYADISWEPRCNIEINAHFYKICDLSFASTETKYTKLKTKTQNNIVIFGIFHKKLYYYFGFFWNNLTKKPVFTKKLFWVLVIGFLNLVSVDAKERSNNSKWTWFFCQLGSALGV